MPTERQSILYRDGSVSYVRLTRLAWRKTHRDFKSGRLGFDALVKNA